MAANILYGFDCSSNWKNRFWLSQKQAFSFLVLTWVIGLGLAIASVLLFPSTTISIYCRRTTTAYHSISYIFNEIYYITFPVGLAAVLATSEYLKCDCKKTIVKRSSFQAVAYSCIVVRVKLKRDKLKSRMMELSSRDSIHKAALSRQHRLSTYSDVSEDELDTSVRLTICVSEPNDGNERQEDFVSSPEGGEKNYQYVDKKHFLAIPSFNQPDYCKRSLFSHSSTQTINSSASDISSISSLTDPSQDYALSLVVRGAATSAETSPFSPGPQSVMSIPEIVFSMPDDEEHGSNNNANQKVSDETGTDQKNRLTANRKSSFFDDEDGFFYHRKRQISRSIRSLTLSRTRKREQFKRRRKSEAKTAIRSTYILLLFLALWLPLPISVALSYLNLTIETHSDRVQFYMDLQVCAFSFGMLSAAANPIIYGLAIKTFRQTFSKLYKTHKDRLLSQWTGP